MEHGVTQSQRRARDPILSRAYAARAKQCARSTREGRGRRGPRTSYGRPRAGRILAESRAPVGARTRRSGRPGTTPAADRGPAVGGVHHAYADRTTGVRTYESDGRRVAGASRKTPKTTIPRRSENTTQIHAIRSPHAAARHARRAPGPARTPKSPEDPERNELSTKNKTVQKHVRLLVGYFTPM
jgi:hypothetical protein